jgi:hypothetical protein
MTLTTMIFSALHFIFKMTVNVLAGFFNFLATVL